MPSPINLTWNGEAFEPINRFWASKCDQRFVVGESYTLDEVHARSTATHAHYFATLHDIWLSLPEAMGDKFPTEEHLRKYALIRTGYRTETQHVCKTPAEAERLAAAIEPYDTYQVVFTDEAIVTVYNAISQDMRSMDKQTFQRSKEAVLDFCSELVGIEPAETRRSAGLPAKSQSGEVPPPPLPVDDAPLALSQQEPDASGSAKDGSANQPPLPAGAEPSDIHKTWLLNVARMLWAATNFNGDIDVLKNQNRSAMEAYAKPADCPKIIKDKADAVYSYCKQIVEGSIDADDGKAIVAGVAMCDQDDLDGKAGAK